MSSVLAIMRTSSSLFVLSGTAMGLTAIAIAVILLASNFTIINAQPQQVTNQPGGIENGATPAAAATTTPFQSTNDSFRVQVPQGWIIQDLNNTGSVLLESTQGYAILAQLCPEEQQQGAVLSNASGSTNSSSINTSSCQGAQDVIHIVRYPDLDARIQPANNITAYHLQKLEEVGYSGIQTVTSIDTTVNLTNPLTNEAITTVPAKFVEMTYTTAIAPNETRNGYLISTATNATAPNSGTTKGYTIFYEGNSTTAAAAAEITAASGSLLPPLPPAVGQVFGSFQLIVAPEVTQAAETTEDTTDNDDDDDADDDGDDNGGDDDDGDDNGGDDDDGDDNGGDDDGGNGDDDGGNGDDDGGNGGGGASDDEFDVCVVPPGRDPGDVGC